MRTLMLAVVAFGALLIAGCNGPPPEQQSNTGPSVQNMPEGHPDIPTGPVEPNPKLGELKAAAETAREQYEKSPDDEAAKKAYAAALIAYAETLHNDPAFTREKFRRAWVMFRKALALDPGNADAKMWIEQYEAIYESMPDKKPPADAEPDLEFPPLAESGGASM